MSDAKITTLRLVTDADQFPGIRSCVQCIHYLSGVSGEYCRAYNEDLIGGYQAQDCSEYED